MSKRIYRILQLTEFEIEESKKVKRDIIQIIKTEIKDGIKLYTCLVLWYPEVK